MIHIFIFSTFILMFDNILDFFSDVYFFFFFAILKHTFKINDKEKCQQLDKFVFFSVSFKKIYIYIYIFNGFSFS